MAVVILMERTLTQEKGKEDVIKAGRMGLNTLKAAIYRAAQQCTSSPTSTCLPALTMTTQIQISRPSNGSLLCN